MRVKPFKLGGLKITSEKVLEGSGPVLDKQSEHPIPSLLIPSSILPQAYPDITPLEFTVKSTPSMHIQTLHRPYRLVF